MIHSKAFAVSTVATVMVGLAAATIKGVATQRRKDAKRQTELKIRGFVLNMNNDDFPVTVEDFLYHPSMTGR